MKILLELNELECYIDKLLRQNFPFQDSVQPISSHHHNLALERLEHCFSRINRKYYQSEGSPLFNPLNGDHFGTYLWFLADTIFKSNSDDYIPILLSHLNKRLHGFDLFYSVSMPSIFLLVHPVGSVFGSASYSDYFVGYQNCTIGSDGVSYPSLQEGVICYSRTSILGDSSIGSNVVMAANSFVLNTSVPSNTIVTGGYPNNTFHRNLKTTSSRAFGAIS